jgi:hypothetical protein
MKTHLAPKNFTESDIDPRGDMPTIYAEREDLIYAPLWWQRQGLSQTASGYGRKLTNTYKVSFEGKPYRLYTTCFSNCGSTWFTVKGRKIWVN